MQDYLSKQYRQKIINHNTPENTPLLGNSWNPLHTTLSYSSKPGIRHAYFIFGWGVVPLSPGKYQLIQIIWNFLIHDLLSF